MNAGEVLTSRFVYEGFTAQSPDGMTSGPYFNTIQQTMLTSFKMMFGISFPDDELADYSVLAFALSIFWVILSVIVILNMMTGIMVNGIGQAQRAQLLADWKDQEASNKLWAGSRVHKQPCFSRFIAFLNGMDRVSVADLGDASADYDGDGFVTAEEFSRYMKEQGVDLGSSPENSPRTSPTGTTDAKAADAKAADDKAAQEKPSEPNGTSRSEQEEPVRQGGGVQQETWKPGQLPTVGGEQMDELSAITFNQEEEADVASSVPVAAPEVSSPSVSEFRREVQERHVALARQQQDNADRLRLVTASLELLLAHSGLAVPSLDHSEAIADVEEVVGSPAPYELNPLQAARHFPHSTDQRPSTVSPHYLFTFSSSASICLLTPVLVQACPCPGTAD